jgi:hypothetical protein
VLTKTKIAIGVFVIVCAASSGFAKNHYSNRNGAEFGAARAHRSLAQSQTAPSHPNRHGPSAFAAAPARQQFWRRVVAGPRQCR